LQQLILHNITDHLEAPLSSILYNTWCTGIFE